MDSLNGSADTCQPCENYKPSEVGEAAYYGSSTAHTCPECGGIRYFCGNCWRDHHANGWESCSVKTMVRWKCGRKACMLAAYRKLGELMAVEAELAVTQDKLVTAQKALEASRKRSG